MSKLPRYCLNLVFACKQNAAVYFALIGGQLVLNCPTTSHDPVKLEVPSRNALWPSEVDWKSFKSWSGPNTTYNVMPWVRCVRGRRRAASYIHIVFKLSDWRLSMMSLRYSTDLQNWLPHKVVFKEFFYVTFSQQSMSQWRENPSCFSDYMFYRHFYVFYELRKEQ